MQEASTTSVALAGLAPDGSRFMLRNEFAHVDQANDCAAITSTGGWLDLTARSMEILPVSSIASESALRHRQLRCADTRRAIPGEQTPTDTSQHGFEHRLLVDRAGGTTCAWTCIWSAAEHGFSVADMMRLKIGPVIMKDEIEYFREVHLLQEIRVSFALAGLAPDGSRFMLRNEFAHVDGKRCAAITSTGGWLDLNARKLIAPPEPLRAALAALLKVEGFRETQVQLAVAVIRGQSPFPGNGDRPAS